MVAAWVGTVFEGRHLIKSDLVLGCLQREGELLLSGIDRTLGSKDRHVPAGKHTGILPQSDIKENIAQWGTTRSGREDCLGASHEGYLGGLQHLRLQDVSQPIAVGPILNL